MKSQIRSRTVYLIPIHNILMLMFWWNKIKLLTSFQYVLMIIAGWPKKKATTELSFFFGTPCTHVHNLLFASVAVQGNRSAVQLPPASDLLLDARRRTVPSHHHRLCIQRIENPALVLHHYRMGYVITLLCWTLYLGVDNRSWYKRCNNIVSFEFLSIRMTCDYI